MKYKLFTHTSVWEPRTALWLRQIWPRVSFLVLALPAAACDTGKYLFPGILYKFSCTVLVSLKLSLYFEWAIESGSAFSLFRLYIVKQNGSLLSCLAFFVDLDISLPSEDAKDF